MGKGTELSGNSRAQSQAQRPASCPQRPWGPAEGRSMQGTERGGNHSLLRSLEPRPPRVGIPRNWPLSERRSSACCGQGHPSGS